MRRTTQVLGVLCAVAVAACSDGSAPGAPDGQASAIFEGLADSLEHSGDSWRADALRHAAAIARLAGEPTTVVLTVDGQRRTFHAVAEELVTPLVACTWPGDTGQTDPDEPPPPVPMDSGGIPPSTGGDPGDSGSCKPAGSYRMRTLIAWEPERLGEVVRLVADDGAGHVTPSVPDVMAGPEHGAIPTTVDSAFPGDSGVASPPVSITPGFMAEYFVRDEGFWWSVEGTQENTLEQDGGACSDDTVTLEWASFQCEAIAVRFQFAMTVERFIVVPLDGWSPRDSLPPAPEPQSRRISMDPASVKGVRLSLLEWTLPTPVPEPGPMPVPSDSGQSMPGDPGGGARSAAQGIH
jgi:hypothetical protein